MHPIAYYAVAATILTSALGAFLLCVLVFRYGFEPPEDEVVEDRHRRFFVTRLGHAGGAVCFAITAGLAAVALGMPSRTVVDVPRPEVTRADVAALRAGDSRVDEALRAIAERLARTETSIADVRANAARAADVAKAERAAASRPVANVTPAERRRAPAAKVDARDSRPRPATTPERRPQPRASAVEPLVPASPASTDTASASPATSEPAPEPEKPPVRVAAAPPVRAAAPPSAEPPPIPRSEPRAEADAGPGVGYTISRVGSEIGRTIGRLGRDVVRFVEDLR